MAEPRDSDVAIIGMSCRLPGGVASPADFWRRLCDGDELVTFFSDEELEASGVTPELLRDPCYVRARGVLDDVDGFDAALFALTAREAAIMDPQHRLFLECAWEALEAAGYDPKRFDGRIGVYAGAGLHDRGLAQLTASRGRGADAFQVALLTEKDYLTTRTSYLLDLKGPSVNVQSACSTSLVALHLACQSLLTGESDLALAGGVSLAVPHRVGYLHDGGHVLSPDGHCRAFDRRGRGFVIGHGAGLVVLKRAGEAVADGDVVHALVKGSALNNDGAAKVGFTAPGVDAQTEVIEEAQAVAGTSPETIGYVEAHGTATPLGDPIEIAALTRAFRAGTEKRGFCAVGSVKTNVGHLGEAAGVTALIKTVLALTHRRIPASLHFEEPNPEIDFESSPFYVNRELRDWPAGEAPRRAGVSSFGLGGTNAHVVLEEAPAADRSGASRPWQPILLSAATPTALNAASAALADFLEKRPDVPLADVAYTLQVGRAELTHRRCLVARDPADAVSVLRGGAPGRLRTAARRPRRRGVVFLFPGGGSQTVDMGRQLYEHESAFRRWIDTTRELFRPHLEFDPWDELARPGAQVSRPSLALPVLFATEYALARLWMSWGVCPRAMIGHSLGEYVAACLADVLTLEDAVALVALRGRLFERLPAGGMASVPLTEDELRSRIGHELSVAAVNASDQCVVSGLRDAVDAFVDSLAREGIESRPLTIDVAAHSSLVEGALEELENAVGTLRPRAPRIPYVSNVTGDWITESDATDPSYWTRHLRRTVRFADGLGRILEDEDPVLLEVGPGRTLVSIARRNADVTSLTSLPHADDEASELPWLLTALGRLWLAGTQVDWNAYYGEEHRCRIELPTYPFERRRMEPVTVTSARVSVATYVPGWRRGRPPSLSNRSEPANETWLVFFVGQAAPADPSGRRNVIVSPGERFARTAEDRYVLRPAAIDDYEALWTDLAERDLLPDRVVHLWTLDGDEQETGFLSLLFLARAWAEKAGDRPLRLDVVSSGLFDVTGEERLRPERATILGLALVLPVEHPEATCRVIDFDDTWERLTDELSVAVTDPVVALRRGHRWVPTYDAVALEARRADARLRRGGVYLVTGGLGGVGLEMARHLAAQWQAKLVLVGRSARGDDPRLEAIRDAGGEVHVVRADVTRIEEMRAVFERFGPFHGVVHAAGVGGGGLIRLRTAGDVAAVFAPKMTGTRVLESLLLEEQAGEPPDFLLLCSSLSAVVGGVGGADYAAANAFLDAFAYTNTLPEKTEVVSVNWDLWKGVGLAADPKRLASRRFWQLDTDPGLEPVQGIEIFRQALGAGVPQVVVSVLELESLIEASRSFDFSRELAALEEQGGLETRFARPSIETPYVAPGSELERRVAEIWQELLGIDRVGIHDGFLDLGGHSLLATRVLARLRRRLGVELDLREFFRAATVAGVVRVLEESRGEDREVVATVFDGFEDGAL